METTHTPGPWETAEHNWQETSVYALDKTICQLRISEEPGCGEMEDLESEQAANAKLIAAAPDLLVALQYILSNLDGMGIKVANRLQADEAIRKATL